MFLIENAINIDKPVDNEFGEKQVSFYLEEQKQRVNKTLLGTYFGWRISQHTAFIPQQ